MEDFEKESKTLEALLHIPSYSVSFHFNFFISLSDGVHSLTHSLVLETQQDIPE